MKKSVKLNVTGMHCPSCEILVKEALQDAGAQVNKISHKSGQVELEFDDSKINLNKIVSLIKNEGYGVK